MSRGYLLVACLIIILAISTTILADQKPTTTVAPISPCERISNETQCWSD